MISPNLRSFAAAVACLISAQSIANAQDGVPGGYGEPSYLRMPQHTYQAPIQDHYIRGNTELWDESRPIEQFVGDVASRSWVKLEFLMWNNSSDHDRIGAPVTGLQRDSRGDLEGETVPIPLLDNLNGGTDVGSVLFPNATTLDNNDIPGARGTFGLDLNGADMELSFFGMQQATSSFFAQDLSAARTRAGLADVSLGTTAFPNIAVPLLTDGTPAAAADVFALIFSESFSANLSTQMWGSEIAFLTDSNAPGGAGASWQWLGGFRYVNVDEAFGFQGTQVGGPTTLVRSTSINNFYGPEVGARMALTSKFFTLSATPRIMMGLNDNSSDVSSIIQGTAGAMHQQRQIDFGTVTQINLAAEVHFSPQFSIYGGYDFMVLTGTSKPFNNVIYNSTTDALGNRIVDINQDVHLKNLLVNGFSLGAVFRY